MVTSSAKKHLRDHLEKTVAPARELVLSGEPLERFIFCLIALEARPDCAVKVFHALQRDFVDWNEVRVAGVKELSDLFESKGAGTRGLFLVKGFLHYLFQTTGMISIREFDRESTKKKKEALLECTDMDEERIGIVLTEYTGKFVSPVSTSVQRVLKRLGLLEKDTQSAFVAAVEGLTRKDFPFSLAHYGLRTVAMRFCGEEEPQCRYCGFRKDCDTAAGRSKA